MCINQNVHRGYKYDKKLRSCVPKRGFVYAYPFFGRPKDTSNQTGQNAQGSNGQNGNGQTGNGNGNGAGNGNGNGASGGNGQNTGETYLQMLGRCLMVVMVFMLISLLKVKEL